MTRQGIEPSLQASVTRAQLTLAMPAVYPIHTDHEEEW